PVDAAVVDEEQVAAAGAAPDVGVFADLDVTVRADDRQPPVAERRQARRGEPVDPRIAGAAVAASMRSPKSSNAGRSQWWKLPTCAAVTSASVELVKWRNWSTWCEAISTRMPPWRALSQNHAGRPSPIRCGPSPTVCTTSPIAPA